MAAADVLTPPVSTVIIGLKTIAELEEHVRFAKIFHPLTPAEMEGTGRNEEALLR
jgi:aryl-alcohol dehydrogenase-like predicted oxidoreductase